MVSDKSSKLTNVIFDLILFYFFFLLHWCYYQQVFNYLCNFTNQKIYSEQQKVSLKKIYFTKTETENILLYGLNIKNFVPTYARFSFGQVRGLTPTKSSDSEYVTESESESEGKNDTSNLLFNQTWSTSESETESSLDSEDKAIMRERMKKEGIIITLFESENERQKIEPVPIPLPRASWNFPDVKTRNIFFFHNWTSKIIPFIHFGMQMDGT